jgi:protocatechuate 3,4-dioxygenase beta subunit
MQTWERYSLSRRGFLAGAVALGTLKAMPADPGCTLTAEQEEGPYYIASQNIRRTLIEDKAGVSVTLRIAVVDAKTCAPLPNAAVDIWQCDASGIYSGFAAAAEGGPGMDGPGGRRGPGRPEFGPPNGPDGPVPPPPDFARGGPGRGPGGPPPSRITDATRFLRGVQISGKDGMVEFEALYPGWYPGRAIHIHMKVHLGGAMAAEKYAGGHVSHTGQLFLPEDVTAQVAKLPPYAKRLNVHRTTQAEDHVYNDQNGAAGLVTLARLKSGSNAEGFLATATLAVDLDATPAGVGGGGRGRGGRRG